MDVDTFKIRLTALPFLSKADVASYQQRVQQGRLSPETIFREAVRVNKQRKAKEIVKKKREFRFMIADIGLDFWDRRSLIRLIDENTVILRLKARADKLVKIREREDVGKRRARLTKFLTGLKIDRTEKDKLLERFDGGNSVNVLTQNAISLQKKKTSEAVSKDREFLKKAISRIGISSTLQAQLMSKFKPGKGAVQKLIEEAKRLKNVSEKRTISVRKGELSQLAKKLEVAANFSKRVANVDTIEKADALKETIEKAGEKKRVSTITDEKDRLINITKEIGVYSTFSGKIKAIQNQSDLNVVKLDIVETGKNALKKLSNQKNVSLNFSSVINAVVFVDRLAPLKKEIEKAGLNLNDIKKKNEENLQAEKNDLVKKAKRISFNLNIKDVNSKNNVKSMREKIQNAYKKKIQNNKKQLSNFALQANISALGNLTKISNVNTLNMAKEMVKQETKNKLYAIASTLNVGPVLVSKIGTINTIQDVKNVSQAIKSAIQKRTKNMKNIALKQLRKSIKSNRELMIEQKKIEAQQLKINELVEYFNSRRLEPNQQSYLMEQYITYNKPIKTIKKEANNFYVKLFKEHREKSLPKLIEDLKKFELDESNIEYIVNKYTKTYIEPNVLLNEAKIIGNMRAQERWVEIEEELLNYLDRLTLKPENRRKITVALNSYWVNFQPLKKSATNMAVKTRNEPRALERKELVNHMNKIGNINRYNKVQILKNYNQGVSNLNTLKNVVENSKGMKNAQKNIENKAKLNQNQMKKNQNMYFKRYITNNLGLNNSNEKVKKILNNYNKYPNYIQNHMSKANTLKALKNERVRLKNSTKMLPMDEKRNKRIENIKNANDVAQLNSDISDAYLAIIRKEISNMVLQSGVKANVNTGQINSLQKGEEVRAKLMNAIERKRNQEFASVQNAVRNMTQENQTTLIQEFTTQNVPINKMLKKIAEIKDKRSIERKRANERLELLKHLKSLSLSEINVNSILRVFDSTPKKTLNMSKLNANTLHKKIQRASLNEIMKKLILSDDVKTEFLKRFRNTPSDLNEIIETAIQVDAKARKQLDLQKQTRNYVVSLKLGNKDTPILKKITNMLTPQTAKTIRSEAERVKRELNAETVEKKRTEIRAFMNKTTITAGMKRSFIVTVKLNTDLDSLKRKIQAAESLVKNAKGQRGRLRAELRTYLNTLNLTNEERKRIEGGVGDKTKSLTTLKRRARTISERKQIRRLRRGMTKTTNKIRNLKTESNTRQRTVMRTKAAKAFRIKKEELEKIVNKLPLNSKDKKTYLDKLKLPKAPLNGITSNLKKFVKNANISNKKKETYMTELK
jgi:hypothetical protein